MVFMEYTKQRILFHHFRGLRPSEIRRELAEREENCQQSRHCKVCLSVSGKQHYNTAAREWWTGEDNG